MIPPSRQLPAPKGRVRYEIKVEYFEHDVVLLHPEIESAERHEPGGFKVTVGDRYESGLTLGEMLEVVIDVTNGRPARYLRTAHEHYLSSAWLNCHRYLYPSPFDLNFEVA